MQKPFTVDPEFNPSANPGSRTLLDYAQRLVGLTARTGVNQIRGNNPATATGAGIPKQVTNVTAAVANASSGATSTVTVTFQRDPTDTAFAGVTVLVKGYNGNQIPTQVASGTDSPIQFILNNTGEAVSLIVQAYGNAGIAPTASAPTTGIQLPKGSGGGFGTTTVTQIVTQSSGAVAGSMSIGTPVNVTTNPTNVNVSTEGTKDWFVNAGDTSIVPADSDTTIHWKILGGWIRRAFAWWGPTGTITIASNAASVFSITSNIGDDACLGGTRTANFLSASQTCTQLTANNSLAFSNWGFRIGALAGKTSRTLKVYFLFSSGGVATNNQLQITAHMEDGSVADVTKTLSPGVAGILFYTVSITFNASDEGVPMFVNFNVIQNTGDSGTRIGFQAATCF